MISLLPTQQECRQVLTRNSAMLFYSRSTRLVPSQKVLRQATCPKLPDGESWSPIEVEKPKIISSETSYAVSELDRSRVELHADLIDLPSTIKFLESRSNSETKPYMLENLSETQLICLNEHNNFLINRFINQIYYLY
jgi:hypothetical protein